MAESISSTVVIAVDHSNFSDEAFEWYVDRIHRPGNQLVLVHCVEMPSVPSRDTWESQTKAGREKSAELQNIYSAKLQQRGMEAKFMFDFEKPGEFIISSAKKVNADVIVIGTRGMGKIRRTILGSVSNYVMNHAGCPVLVCRSPKD